MNATSDVTEGLRRTMQLMQQELDRSLVSNEILGLPFLLLGFTLLGELYTHIKCLVTPEQSTATMEMTSNQYSTFSTLLTTSKALITSLERADVLDRLILLFAFIFFCLCCAWVVKRRVVDKGLRVAGALSKAVARNSVTSAVKVREGVGENLAQLVGAVTTTASLVASSFAPPRKSQGRHHHHGHHPPHSSSLSKEDAPDSMDFLQDIALPTETILASPASTQSLSPSSTLDFSEPLSPPFTSSSLPTLQPPTHETFTDDLLDGEELLSEQLNLMDGQFFSSSPHSEFEPPQSAPTPTFDKISELFSSVHTVTPRPTQVHETATEPPSTIFTPVHSSAKEEEGEEGEEGEEEGEEEEVKVKVGPLLEEEEITGTFQHSGTIHAAPTAPLVPASEAVPVTTTIFAAEETRVPKETLLFGNDLPPSAAPEEGVDGVVEEPVETASPVAVVEDLIAEEPLLPAAPFVVGVRRHRVRPTHAVDDLEQHTSLPFLPPTVQILSIEETVVDDIEMGTVVDDLARYASPPLVDYSLPSFSSEPKPPLHNGLSLEDESLSFADEQPETHLTPSYSDSLSDDKMEEDAESSTPLGLDEVVESSAPVDFGPEVETGPTPPGPTPPEDVEAIGFGEAVLSDAPASDEDLPSRVDEDYPSLVVEEPSHVFENSIPSPIDEDLPLPGEEDPVASIIHNSEAEGFDGPVALPSPSQTLSVESGEEEKNISPHALPTGLPYVDAQHLVDDNLVLHPVEEGSSLPGGDHEEPEEERIFVPHSLRRGPAYIDPQHLIDDNLVAPTRDEILPAEIASLVPSSFDEEVKLSPKVIQSSEQTSITGDEDEPNQGGPNDQISEPVTLDFGELDLDPLEKNESVDEHAEVHQRV